MRRRNFKELREKLENQRQEVRRFLTRQETETRSLERDIPQDSADRSVLNLSQESLFEQATQRANSCGGSKGPLKRMEHGSFGICQACEQEISQRRLEACLQCQQMIEQGLRQTTAVEAQLTESSRRTD